MSLGLEEKPYLLKCQTPNGEETFPYNGSPNELKFYGYHLMMRYDASRPWEVGPVVHRTTLRLKNFLTALSLAGPVFLAGLLALVFTLHKR